MMMIIHEEMNGKCAENIISKWKHLTVSDRAGNMGLKLNGVAIRTLKSADKRIKICRIE